MMVSLTGIPWIFGYFMLLSRDNTHKEVFAVFFTLFNTSQVCIIIVLYFIKNLKTPTLKIVSIAQANTNSY